MIGQLLPSCAVTVEADEAAWTADLLPEEAAVVARAVEKRRREFAAGRSCARRALESLGWPAFPVRSGPNREPVWPPDVVGSITHSAGYCAAAVAPRSRLRALGIDAERNVPLEEGVVRLTCSPRELGRLPARAGVSWPALVFSAKESVYKVWYPLTRRWLGYLDAELTIEPDRGTFAARLLLREVPDGFPPEGLQGRFAVTDRHVFTAIALR